MVCSVVKLADEIIAMTKAILMICHSAQAVQSSNIRLQVTAFDELQFSKIFPTHFTIMLPSDLRPVEVRLIVGLQLR